MSEGKQLRLEEYYRLIRDNKQLDIRKMKDEAEELLHYSYQVNDTYGQAFAFVHLAIYYMVLRKLDSARFNLAKAEAICIRDKYDKLLISCYCHEGTICQMGGDKIKAIRVYGKAMDLAEKHQENTMSGILYNNVAVILMSYEDMTLAKEYFELAADVLVHLPEQKHNLVQAYTNLACACCALGDMATAHAYIDKAKAVNIENEKADSSIKASEIRIHAEECNVEKVKQGYVEYLKIVDHCKAEEAFFAADILLVAENLLLVDLKEECRALLQRMERLLDSSNLELELQLYKVYIKFQETYGEESAETCEKYYRLLMQSENQEYSSLAESLRGRIKLSEISQKQSALERENEQLQKQAHLDEMTGAFNRRYFDKLLLKMNADGRVENIGCIMLDIDHFKEYNDTYGHLQGDQILKQVTKTLSKHATESIYVGRFGGDEYYCLCSDLRDEQIEAYLTAVYADLRAQHMEHSSNAGGIVTISAGFYNAPKADIILSKVMDCADRALYQAKEKGRDCFAKYEKA